MKLYRKGDFYVPTATVDPRCYSAYIRPKKQLSEKMGIKALLGYEYQVFKWRTGFCASSWILKWSLVDYTNILGNPPFRKHSNWQLFEDPKMLPPILFWKDGRKL